MLLIIQDGSYGFFGKTFRGGHGMRGTSAICLMFLMLGLGLAVGISAQEGNGRDMPMGPPEEMK